MSLALTRSILGRFVQILGESIAQTIAEGRRCYRTRHNTAIITIQSLNENGPQFAFRKGS
jgi:hypothetical protein